MPWKTYVERFREGPEYLTPEEAAEILKVNAETVRDYIKEGRLPAIKKVYGRGPKSFLWFIRKDALKDFRLPHTFNRHIPILAEEVRRAVAWAIAGEGTITINPSHRKNPSGFLLAIPMITITNTEKLFVTEFWRMVGNKGHIFKYSRQKTKGGKDIWSWQLRTIRGCLTLLEQIYNYLPIKKEQAKIVIEFCRLRLEHQSKPYTNREIELIKQIRNLQYRGKKKLDLSYFNRLDRRQKHGNN